MTDSIVPQPARAKKLKCECGNCRACKARVAMRIQRKKFPLANRLQCQRFRTSEKGHKQRAKWLAENPEYHKLWRARNRAKVRGYATKWRKSEKGSKVWRAWYARWKSNPENIRHKAEYDKKYRSRPWHREYKRAEYQKHKERYIARAKRQQDRTRTRNVLHVLAYLKAHPCVDCGQDDPVTLHFDHVRGEKLCAVSRLLRFVSIGKLDAEIAKCEVRCANCHAIRHAKTLNHRRFRLAY